MTHTEEPILLEKRDQIAYITMNRPKKLNALRWEDYVLLDDLIHECEKDKDIRVVILTGKGKAFCAGDDISSYPGTDDLESYTGDSGFRLLMENKFLEALTTEYQIPTQRHCQTILNSGKIWIAAVNGVCWMPEVLYAMDFVIAADVASIAQGDVRNGICPGGSSTQLLPRLVGRRHAIEFLLRSEEISAEEAYRIGIVNKVVPLSQLMPEAEALARKMLKRPMEAIKLVKMAVNKGYDMPLKNGLELEYLYCAITMSQSQTWLDFYRRFKAGEFKKKNLESD
jgi:enoyl-CoA hydratase/carnithine racemase